MRHGTWEKPGYFLSRSLARQVGVGGKILLHGALNIAGARMFPFYAIAVVAVYASQQAPISDWEYYFTRRQPFIDS